METHSRGHKREDRKTSLMDRLVAENTIEPIRPDDVTYIRFARKAHIDKYRAKEILEDLADQGRLKRVHVKHKTGGRIIAYRE